jgi:hypothetical protein
MPSRPSPMIALTIFWLDGPAGVASAVKSPVSGLKRAMPPCVPAQIRPCLSSNSAATRSFGRLRALRGSCVYYSAW